MGRVISYGEKTGYNDGDYLLIDNGEDGTKRIRPSLVGPRVDSVPTQGSNNAVSSGGVYDALHNTDVTLTHSGQAADAKAVGDKLTPLIGGDEQREITGWIYSKLINTGSAVEIGDTVDITNFTDWYSLKHVVVECQEGDRFLLDITGATNARAYAFLTSDNVLISRSDAGQTISEYIIAPQNTGKVIIQGIYRQSDTDTTTDNGKAYKILQGSGNVVRFDTTQNKTEAEKARARENLGIIGSGSGLSNEAKAALLACFEHVAWIDEHGMNYYTDLRNALYAESTAILTATFNQQGDIITPTDSIESLKKHLDVTEIHSDQTITPVNDYTISGALTSAVSTITVEYRGKTATFNVNVTLLPNGYMQKTYVQANGTQYIKSGLNETNVGDYSWKLKEEVSSLQSRSGHILSSQNFYVPFLWYSGSERYVNAERFGGVYSQQVKTPWELNQAYELEAYTKTTNGIYLNGEQVYQWPKGSNIANSELTFFTYGGNVSNTVYRFYGKLYYLKAYNANGNKAHDYIPCVNSNNVVGLYDLVSGTFLQPATGTLTSD